MLAHYKVCLGFVLFDFSFLCSVFVDFVCLNRCFPFYPSFVVFYLFALLHSVSTYSLCYISYLD
jgi:hypothetical protein